MDMHYRHYVKNTGKAHWVTFQIYIEQQLFANEPSKWCGAQVKVAAPQTGQK
jgi:hypothetical protein